MSPNYALLGALGVWAVFPVYTGTFIVVRRQRVQM